MIVAEFDIEHVAVFETKADTPLRVDRNGVLSGAIVLERVQSVTRRHAQIGELDSDVQRFQLAQGASGHVRWNPPRLAGPKELLGLAICKGLDHIQM